MSIKDMLTKEMSEYNYLEFDIGYVSYVVTTIPFPFHECDLQN